MDQRYLAGEIRAELGRQNLSQADLAAELGWTEAYLSRRLTGQVSFSLGDITAIARGLRVSRSQLVDKPEMANDRRVS